jgi:hypothetical protein
VEIVPVPAKDMPDKIHNQTMPGEISGLQEQLCSSYGTSGLPRNLKHLPASS